jgi:2,3-dihydroxy-p-cumate/2,3-dihydroxybenzoate 3,4-dioxygenase
VGAKASLNHVNFMVSDIDDIGRAMYRCKKFDAPVVFGPGKHPPSESVFLYFLDPDKLTLEYSFGMEEFPEVEAREPRMMPAARESVDYWGAIPDPAFSKVGEIEKASAEHD